ncbi:SMP-30/gluconolactonase/LRE family protein [uncultured Alsobacter sp.]|uniref:SMP-30/gluconolactonase/LRE family protein n=1 Tax=uncultured Alsobacter sp. TaxID=1748258 RepID=UPI0025CF9D7D|nr:SMP-30/gluconolactonase/LRE family protein [uncultured Alsobacter sp.]
MFTDKPDAPQPAYADVHPVPNEQLDPRAKKLFNGTAKLDRLYTGCRWAEGPAYFPAGRYLVWSDIPNNRMMRYDETDGSVSVFRTPANNTNGHTVDRQGRLVSCEHLTRRVTRTEFDGTITVIADRYQGKRLNSPNDVVVKSDGSIWFTDPAYGIDSDYEGERAESEIGACHVYRVDGQTGEITIACNDFVRPNGIAFSPDESKLYVADTGATHVENGPRHIRVFTVGADGRSLSGGEVFATCTKGLFDGFRFDEDGRLWTSAADGVHVYHPDGTLIAKVHVPEVVANVCFGGRHRTRLYICGTTSMYAYSVLVRGAKTF